MPKEKFDIGTELFRLSKQTSKPLEEIIHTYWCAGIMMPEDVEGSLKRDHVVLDCLYEIYFPPKNILDDEYE